MKSRLAAILEPSLKHWNAIAQGLKQAGVKVTSAAHADELKRESMVVIGPSVPTGSKVCAQVKKRLPRAFVLAAQSKGFKAAWADAILPLPVSPNDLKVRLQEFERRLQAPSEVAAASDGILDPVTQFYRYQHFKEVLVIEVKRARRYGFPLAVAVITMDEMTPKPKSDVAKQLFASLSLSIRRSLRDTDYPILLEHQRVLLVMPHTDLAGALIVARRVVERASRAVVQHRDEVFSPTISMGVAAGTPDREYHFADLFRQAEEGLLEAQTQGGNRVESRTLPASIGLVPLNKAAPMHASARAPILTVSKVAHHANTPPENWSY